MLCLNFCCSEISRFSSLKNSPKEAHKNHTLLVYRTLPTLKSNCKVTVIFSEIILPYISFIFSAKREENVKPKKVR